MLAGPGVRPGEKALSGAAGRRSMSTQGSTVERQQAEPALTIRPRVGTAEQARRMLRRSWRPAAALVALLVVWWVVTAARLIAPYLVPSPGSTVASVAAQPGYF